jgi:hypothetical protein
MQITFTKIYLVTYRLREFRVELVIEHGIIKKKQYIFKVTFNKICQITISTNIPAAKFQDLLKISGEHQQHELHAAG